MKNIDQYLNKELSEKELNSFTQKLMQYRFDKQQKVNWKKKLEEEYQVIRSSPAKPKSKRFLWIAIAAAIALAIIAIPFYQSYFDPTPQQIAASFLLKDVIPIGVARKGAMDKEVNSLVEEIKIAHANKDYPKAIKAGEQLLSITPVKPQYYFYQGQSFLLSEMPSKAIPLFKSVLKENKIYQSESRWLLSLAYILDHQEDAGKKELEYFITEEGWKTEEATKLLNALQR